MHNLKDNPMNDYDYFMDFQERLLGQKDEPCEPEDAIEKQLSKGHYMPEYTPTQWEVERQQERDAKIKKIVEHYESRYRKTWGRNYV